MPVFTAIGAAILGAGASAAAAAATGIAAVGAAAAAAGAGYSVYAGEQGRKAQNEAMKQQREAQDRSFQQAEEQSRKSEEAMRRANQNAPDVSGILSSAAQRASGGPSGTMLTGPGGVKPEQLSLGRSTLLGQ